MYNQTTFTSQTFFKTQKHIVCTQHKTQHHLEHIMDAYWTSAAPLRSYLSEAISQRCVDFGNLSGKPCFSQEGK